MKTLSRIRGLLQGFSDVGPETKGFGMEMALAFLMISSLALFFFFSAAEKKMMEADIVPAVEQETSGTN